MDHTPDTLRGATLLMLAQVLFFSGVGLLFWAVAHLLAPVLPHPTTRTAAGGQEGIPMDLDAMLSSSCVHHAHNAGDRAQVLEQIAALAASHPNLAGLDEAHIRRALAQREALASTACGGAVAIPHCRLPGANGFVLGLFRLTTPIDWSAPDGQPVDLVVFVLGPDEGTRDYIQLLSSLAHILRKNDLRPALAATTTDADAHALFRERLLVQLASAHDDARCLFHIAVRDEDAHQRVLECLAAIPGSNPLVIDTTSGTAALTRMPLFADLWQDSSKRSVHLTLATIPRRRANELVRTIEAVVGPLAGNAEACVAVQDLSYCAGALD